MRPDEKPALLVRVLTEIGSGRIYERFLAGQPGERVSGLCEGPHIHINPAFDTIDSVIHEALHRLEPRWSERYVRRTTTWLMQRMSDAQIEALYDEYQARKKPRKKRRC